MGFTPLDWAEDERNRKPLYRNPANQQAITQRFVTEASTQPRHTA
ncbi:MULTISPECIES: hypothetical protein [Prochlorococcus]|nr:hypothetical protein [Prochlorococcus marinus]